MSLFLWTTGVDWLSMARRLAIPRGAHARRAPLIFFMLNWMGQSWTCQWAMYCAELCYPVQSSPVALSWPAWLPSASARKCSIQFFRLFFRRVCVCVPCLSTHSESVVRLWHIEHVFPLLPHSFLVFSLFFDSLVIIYVIVIWCPVHSLSHLLLSLSLTLYLCSLPLMCVTIKVLRYMAFNYASHAIHESTKFSLFNLSFLFFYYLLFIIPAFIAWHICWQ